MLVHADIKHSNFNQTQENQLFSKLRNVIFSRKNGLNCIFCDREPRYENANNGQQYLYIMAADWEGFETTKILVFGENEPHLGIEEWIEKYLKDHFNVEEKKDVIDELVNSADIEPDQDDELPFEKIVEYAHRVYEADIHSLLEELNTTLTGIQQKFTEHKFKPTESLDFELTKGRTSAFNDSIMDLFAAIDPDFSKPGTVSDSSIKQALGIEEEGTELEFLQSLKSMAEDLEPVVNEWNDWVSDNGTSNAEQVLNELFVQSKNEVIDLSRVKADVALWTISEFINSSVDGKLDIDPIYQRNDVWAPSASISLIHSILRGIPLPSVILWENASGHFQVIDGKQRISSILKFYGAHPSGFQLLESKMPQLKEHLISKLSTKNKPFETVINTTENKDIARHVLGHSQLSWGTEIKVPNIGQWLRSQHYGPTGPEENQIAKKFLPFKLNGKTVNSSVPVLRATSKKYYWQTKEEQVEHDGPTIKNIFKAGSSTYKIPVIKFDKETTPSQIRQVFKLYNSTGMKLNPTEQNNASYQNQLSLKLVLTVCNIRPERGDELFEDTDFNYPDIKQKVEKFTLLDDFGVKDTRFNQMKIMSWVLSFLYQNTRKEDGGIGTPSTTAFIESFFENAGSSSSFLGTNLEATLEMLIAASALINSNDDEKVLNALSEVPKFTNKKAKQDEWDDLASVSMMVGSCLVVCCISNWKEIAEKKETVKSIKEYMKQLELPAKQQTKDQWEYFAKKVIGFCEVFGLNKDNLDENKFHGNNVLANFHDLLN